MKRLRIVARRGLRSLREVIFGMTLYDWAHELDKARHEQERLFILLVYGDLLGLPLLPPLHALRLLPYVVPALDHWRRSMLRERDLTDIMDQELG